MALDCRPERVNDMVNILVDHLMIQGEELSQNEVLAIGMTLNLRLIQAALALGADPEKIRKGIEVLMLQCTPRGLAN